MLHISDPKQILYLIYKSEINVSRCIAVYKLEA